MTKHKRRGHGEGSVYERKDGRWAAELSIEDGKRKTFYGKTQKEALEKLRKAQREQEQGTLVTGPQQKLKDYLEQWFEDVHKHDVRESSYVKHRSLFKHHILPGLGHVQVQKLTPQQVQSFYTRKLNEGLSPSTVTAIHGVLHKALKNAVRWNLVSRNVCDAVSPPRRSGHEAQPLTKEQAQKLLEVARGHRLEALLTVALTTGMRQGELLALRWQDIDFAHQSLSVHHSVLSLPGRGFVESEPKTARGRRRIGLPQFVIEALKHQRVFLTEARLKAGSAWCEHDLVFPSVHGGFFDHGGLYRMFQRVLKKADLPRMRFHDLRHSTATILLMMGVHPKVVQEILGHSNISMTMDTYSHILPSMQDDAMDKWNTLLGG